MCKLKKTSCANLKENELANLKEIELANLKKTGCANYVLNRGYDIQKTGWGF